MELAGQRNIRTRACDGVLYTVRFLSIKVQTKYPIQRGYAMEIVRRLPFIIFPHIFSNCYKKGECGVIIIVEMFVKCSCHST